MFYAENLLKLQLGYQIEVESLFLQSFRQRQYDRILSVLTFGKDYNEARRSLTRQISEHLQAQAKNITLGKHGRLALLPTATKLLV